MNPVHVNILFPPEQQSTADLISANLTAHNIRVSTGAPQKDQVIVAVLTDPKRVPPDVFAALDLNLHVVPVLVGIDAAPNAIGHLTAFDFTHEQPLDDLRAQIAYLASDDAPPPLRVLTPKVARANRQAGGFIGIIAAAIFLFGIIGVGFLGIRRPDDEFDMIDTQAALTIQALAGPELLFFTTWLPQSTDDALNYQATLAQLPTAYRPLMAWTVTAIAQGTPHATPPAPPTPIRETPSAPPAPETTDES